MNSHLRRCSSEDTPILSKLLSISISTTLLEVSGWRMPNPSWVAAASSPGIPIWNDVLVFFTDLVVFPSKYRFEASKGLEENLRFPELVQHVSTICSSPTNELAKNQWVSPGFSQQICPFNQWIGSFSSHPGQWSAGISGACGTSWFAPHDLHPRAHRSACAGQEAAWPMALAVFWIGGFRGLPQTNGFPIGRSQFCIILGSMWGSIVHCDVWCLKREIWWWRNYGKVWWSWIGRIFGWHCWQIAGLSCPYSQEELLR